MRLCLLGQFAIEFDGVSYAGPRAKKSRLLLAYLGLHLPHVAERQRLAELLWPDVDSAGALFNLRQALAVMRREAPYIAQVMIAGDRRTIGLDISRLEVDVSEFRICVRESPEDAV